MKKVLLSALAICAFGFTNAQSHKTGTMQVNVMGGFLSGNYTVKSDAANSEKLKATATGAQFGANFQYGFADNISAGIGLEVGTSVLSYNYSSYNPSISTFKVIASGRYYFLNKEKFNIYAGPSVGFTTGSDKTIYGGYGFDKTKYSGLNYGVNAGANYFFTDMVGVIMNVGYEGNSLNAKQKVDGVEYTGKTTLGGVKVMAGLVLKF